MRDGVQMTIIARGLTELKKELTSVAPDLKNQLLKVYRNAANDVASGARARMPEAPPMSGWRTVAPAKPRGRGWIAWDGARANAGIVAKLGVRDPEGRGKLFGYRVLNASPQGAISEIAGRRGGGKQGLSTNPNAGVQFIKNLDRLGNAGRFIWAAYDSKASQILADTTRETERIAAEYERRLNTLGGGS